MHTVCVLLSFHLHDLSNRIRELIDHWVSVISNESCPVDVTGIHTSHIPVVIEVDVKLPHGVMSRRRMSKMVRFFFSNSSAR